MELYINQYSYISPKHTHPTVTTAGEGLTPLYRAIGIDYPKFFKMDNLAKLGFLAAELLLQQNKRNLNTRKDIATICFNRSSSLDTDRLYQTTINPENNYPSPSLFVYTLPNILTAEIAIRNKFTGETSTYITPSLNPETIVRTVRQTLNNTNGNTAITGWTEYADDTHEAFMMLINKQHNSNTTTPFTPEQVNKLIIHLRKQTNNK
ncbi:MAG: hypothetical protein LBH04_02245 [Tannerellaceae bacterium]|jgi:hypothetical protein|nr:hypothetical protein [Tannerellaceae bacterium]